MRLKIYTDGASSGNPGPAAIGVSIRDENGKKLVSLSRHIGLATNNQAEYRAVIAALEAAIKLKPTEVTLHLDSELVARQLTGIYKVKSPSLANLYSQAWKLAKGFRDLTIVSVSGSENKEAHALAQTALKKFRWK